MIDFWHAVAFGAGASASYFLCKFAISFLGAWVREIYLFYYHLRNGVSDKAQLNLIAAKLGDVSQIKPSSVWDFTPDWTDQERVKLCVLFTHIFRDDFTSGKYGKVGRPNVQSLHEILMMDSTELEQHRYEIEAIAYAYENKLDVGEVLDAVTTVESQS